MQVGLDLYTIRELELTPFQTLEFLKSWDFEGAMFGGLEGMSKTLDAAELREFRAEADDLGLYTQVSVPTCNPYLVVGSLDEHAARLQNRIELAAACGWHELHSSLGGIAERYEHPVPWTRHLAEAADLIRRLGPVLRQHKSRINLETHGDTTTFELVRLIEEVGSDIVGICLDTANVLCHAEDPVQAARRAAPYTHMTHTKDAVIFLTESGYTRQTLPIGKGALDFKNILLALGQYSPDLPLSIEDHKGLYDFALFDPDWQRLHPDLTREELAAVVRLAWKCQQRLAAGELLQPEEYEKIPFLQECEERLAAGRDYLQGLLTTLGLHEAAEDPPA